MQPTTTIHRGDSLRNEDLVTSTVLLRARVELADAIVTAARDQLREAAERPNTPANVSLYEGCKAGLRRRQEEAAELRSQLIHAQLVAGSREVA